MTGVQTCALPISLGFDYTWTVTSGNVFTKPSTTKDTLTVYFTNDTSTVVLKCNVQKSGITIKNLTKIIKVNPKPTLAEQLAQTSCPRSQTTCSSVYIDNFNIASTNIKSPTLGCSSSGYSDFTSSENYDTLYVGDNYQGVINYSAPANTIAYVGAWIDYNNDGKINEEREFVGSSFSASGTMTINNIVLPTDIETGPKRIRIRIRLTAPFSIGDVCPTNDEEAETEDYLAVIDKYDGVKTPNFITPNNDGKNDYFIIQGVAITNTLKVFNRIGDLVYDTNNYDNTWGGKDQKGNALKPGTYYYVFSQQLPGNDKENVVKGFLEIRY